VNTRRPQVEAAARNLLRSDAAVAEAHSLLHSEGVAARSRKPPPMEEVEPRSGSSGAEERSLAAADRCDAAVDRTMEECTRWADR
jgi:hypothetical protein